LDGSAVTASGVVRGSRVVEIVGAKLNLPTFIGLEVVTVELGTNSVIGLAVVVTDDGDLMRSFLQQIYGFLKISSLHF